MDRRSFTRQLITCVTSFSLLESALVFDAISGKLSPVTDHWVKQLNDYCGDLRKSEITPTEWQSLVQGLFDQITMEELLEFIDMDRLIHGLELPDLGVTTRGVRFPKLSGIPEKTYFIKKVFGMKKDRAIIPHGHSNMVSAHLVLKGEMRLRHYDKLHIEDERMIISPTVDKVAKPGDSSSISDDKDNVHWFIADTNTAYTFDIIMLDLNEKSYDIHNLDIYERQSLGDGTYRVPILDVDTALKKYGKHSHH